MHDLKEQIVAGFQFIIIDSIERNNSLVRTTLEKNNKIENSKIKSLIFRENKKPL